MKLNPKSLLLLLLPGMLLFSCQESEPQKEPASTPEILSIKGNFYLLQCHDSIFNKLSGGTPGAGDPRGNVVFKFYILDGKFTLNGWEIKGPGPVNYHFDASPSVSFMPTNVQSNETYGDSTYLGDFLLNKNQVALIKAALVSRNHHFVVFRPRRISTEILRWEVGTSDIATLNAEALFDPIADAYLDPVPPKRYDEL